MMLSLIFDILPSIVSCIIKKSIFFDCITPLLSINKKV
jgi:hypothetical protein